MISSIRVGRLVQKVLYEGISFLCFCCGKLGHKQDNCGLKVRKPSGEDEAQVSLKSNEISDEVQPESNYGAWMEVMRKRGSGRMGKASGPTKSINPTQVKAKGNPNLSQASAHVEVGDDLGKSNQRDLADSREGTSRVVAAQDLQNGLADPTDETAHAMAAQKPEINLEMRKDCVMEESIENPYAEC